MYNKSDEEPTQLQSNSSEYNYTKSNNPSGLEFVHITKTAGSTIESTAAKSGIKWGACHYKRIRKFGKACSSPDIHLGGSKSVRMEPWHTPHYFFLHNPYEGKPIHLTNETLDILNEVYKADFQRFHYRMIHVDHPNRDDSILLVKTYEWRILLRVQEVLSPLLLLSVICTVLCHIKRRRKAVHSTWFSSLALFFCFLVFLVVIIKLGILRSKTIG